MIHAVGSIIWDNDSGLEAAFVQLWIISINKII